MLHGCCCCCYCDRDTDAPFAVVVVVAFVVAAVPEVPLAPRDHPTLLLLPVALPREIFAAALASPLSVVSIRCARRHVHSEFSLEYQRASNRPVLPNPPATSTTDFPIPAPARVLANRDCPVHGPPLRPTNSSAAVAVADYRRHRCCGAVPPGAAVGPETRAIDSASRDPKSPFHGRWTTQSRCTC